MIYIFWKLINIKLRKVKDFKYIKNTSKEKTKEEVPKEDKQKKNKLLKTLSKTKFLKENKLKDEEINGKNEKITIK